jgi:long-chain acyl-CoA synthetase
MFATHGLRRAARIRGSHPGLAFDGQSRTWGEIETRVSRAAAGLRSLGLERGDRIAVLSENNAAFFELYWAAPWADLIMASLNTRWALPEMQAALENCRASVLIVDSAFVEHARELRAKCAAVQCLVFIGPESETPRGFHSYEALVRENAPIADQLRGGGEVVHLFYTSGTTGESKGVMLTGANVFNAGLMIASPFALSAETRALCVMPMFHVGAGTFLIGLTFAASSIFVAQRFEANSALRAIAEHRITHSVLVPAMINQMLADPEIDAFDLSSMQRLIYGAAPMPSALLEHAMRKMPRVGFNQGYSMTENTATGSCLLPHDHDPRGPTPHRMRSVGQVIAGNDLEIRAPNGAPLAANEIGEVCLRGPCVMAGYWGRPEDTAAVIRNGWLHTGDVGRVDEDGYLYIVDRIKDMIITGGENVYCAEVENAVYAHPAVMECAVIGIADEKWGERVAAIVYRKPGQALDEASLIAHCRTLIGGYKIPRQVIFTDEPLPRSSTGKIQKPQLRRAYGAGS